MLSGIGDKNFTLLTSMMDMLSARHKVMAENIAHVNTSNYRRRQFTFDKALKEALGNGSQEAYQNIRESTERTNNTPVRNNGNNVDIDVEMVSMDQNSVLYEIYTQLYQQKSQMVKKAINGG